MEEESENKIDVLADFESGKRAPDSFFGKKALFVIPLLWALFQLWYVSPLPFIFDFFILNDTKARAVHLAFAVFLTFLAFPRLSSSDNRKIPLSDWILATIAAFCASYIYLFYGELALRPGLPTSFDLACSIVGLLLLLEATRRALGPPLMIVACVFLTYAFFGAYMPDVIAHKGISFSKGMSHYWLSTEGVYGVALGVSTGMVFMFVLFGSLLESTGAGNYFIRTAFAALGHMRGGPAKAAVLSSAMTGLVSGSSIANVVTTGTFTIPLMKKVGFSAEKSGAIEVASSTNGQLTPPVMGAAAFLMVEYVGISYIDVIRHALFPALISYIALIYIVHLEACKLGLEGMVRKKTTRLLSSIFVFLTTVIFLMLTGLAVYYGMGWIKGIAGAGTPYFVGFLLLIAYVLLLQFACKVPDLPEEKEIKEIPSFRETLQAGSYYLLPIVILMWCLVVERLSPATSAFYATLFLMFIVITQHRLKGIFRKQKGDQFSFYLGYKDLIEGLVTSSKNMIGIGVATATAGIVVGTVTITGLGLVMTEFVELISAGNLILILLFTALISLLLGMGLPTTANYIVVSTLMAPVIVNLGAQNGLLVPLIAVHLFVFYFGILADDTPPVGLAAFAAAGISGGNPIKTGIQGFTYDIRTAILPFIFIFNTELLMIGIESWLHFLLLVIASILAILSFASATQNYLICRNKKWETLALLLLSFTLFNPSYFWNKVYPPFIDFPASQLAEIVEQKEVSSELYLMMRGENINGDLVDLKVSLPIAANQTKEAVFASWGIEFIEDEGKLIVDYVAFDSLADKLEISFDYEITGLQVPSNPAPKEWMYVPAILLLAYIVQNQRKRKNLR